MSEQTNPPLTLEEREMIDKQMKSHSDPQEVAAQLFTLYLPRFQQLVDELSNNELRRVLKNVVEFPLADPPIKHISPEEKEAFQIGHQLVQANIMMQIYTYNESLQELQNATEVKNEQVPENTGTDTSKT